MALAAFPLGAVELPPAELARIASTTAAQCSRQQAGMPWAGFDALQCQCLGRRLAAGLASAAPEVQRTGSRAQLRAMAAAANGCRRADAVRAALAPGFLPGEAPAGVTLMSRPPATPAVPHAPQPADATERPASPAAARPSTYPPHFVRTLAAMCVNARGGRPGQADLTAGCTCAVEGWLAEHPPRNGRVDNRAITKALADDATFTRLQGDCPGAR